MSRYSEFKKKEDKEKSNSSNTSRAGKYLDYEKVGFDTFDDDLKNTGNLVNDLYTKWQSPESLSTAQTKVSDMQRRISAYQHYNQTYGAGGTDLSDMLNGYNDILNGWGDLSTLHGQYKSAEAFDTAMKKSKQRSKLTTVSDYDKAIAKSTDEKDKTELQMGRNKREWSNPSDKYDYLRKEKDFDGSFNSNLTLSDMDSKEYAQNHKIGAGYSYELYQLVNGAKDPKDSQMGSQFYNFNVNTMTDEEKEIFNYLFKKNPDEAVNYFKDIRTSLEKRKTEGFMDYLEDQYKGNPLAEVGHSLLSIPANVIGGIGAMANTMYEYDNPYNALNAGVNYANSVRENVANEIAENTDGAWSKILPFLYQTAMSIGDSAIGASTLGKFYTPLMGATASQQRFKELKEQGESDGKAFAGAVASGVAEAFFEKFSIDNLLRKKGVDGLRKSFVETLKQAGIEGSEEIFTEIANKLTDTIFRGNTSDRVQMKNDLVNRGYTEAEAEKEIWGKDIEDVLLAGLGGALSGGVMGGFSSGIEFHDNKKAGAEIRSRDNVTGLTDLASLSDKESELYRLYSEYANNGIGSENITDAQLGNLYNSGMRENAETLADNNATEDDKINAYLSMQNMKNIRSVDNPNKANSADDSQTTDTADDTVSMDVPDDAVDTTITSTVQNVDSVQNVDEATKQIAKDYVYTAGTYATGEENIDVSRVSGILTSEEIKNSYMEGLQYRNKVKEEHLATIKMSEEAVKGKVTLGNFDDKIIDYNSKTTDGSKINWNSLTKKQQNAIRFVQYFSKATGVNVKLIASKVENGVRKGKNGSYDPSSNTIEIDVYAGITDAKKFATDTIVPTLSHEVTHWMEEKAPSLYAKLRESVLNDLRTKGVNIEGWIEEEINRLDNEHGDRKHTREDALAEITARACEDMLSNSEYASSLIAQLTEEERNTFKGKIQGMIADLKKWIKSLMSVYKSTSAEAEFLREMDGYLDRTAKLWDEAFKQAVENNKLIPDAVYQMNPANTVQQFNDKYEKSGKHKKDLEKKYDSENADMSLKEIESRMDSFAETMDNVAKALNSKFLNDWNSKTGENRKFTVFKAQMGYKYAIELSSMCAKGVPLFEAIDTIVRDGVMEKLGVSKLGKFEKEVLYETLKKFDFDIPCAICYVEQARQREGTIISAFANGKAENRKLGWNQVIDSIQEEMNRLGSDYKFANVDRSIATDMYSPATNTMDEETEGIFYKALTNVLNKEIAKYNKEKKKNKPKISKPTREAILAGLKGSLTENLGIFKALAEGDDNRFKIDEDLLYSSHTTRNLCYNHAPLFTLFNRQSGVSGYKTKQSAIVYWGDILSRGYDPEDVRKEGGIRNQSNSDFMMYTLFDYVQMYADMTAKGYYLQAYTKAVEELKLLGLSGGKVNASGIPRVMIVKNSDGSTNDEATRLNAGLDEKGHPIYDSVEGINIDEAKMLAGDSEYSKNIGICCIGYSDNHILALLDDPLISMIIGYHDKTDDPTKRYRGAVYATNYNSRNEAVSIKSGKTKHIGFNKFLADAENKIKEGNGKYKHKDVENPFTYNDIPRLATRLYLDYCKRYGYSPAYSQGGYDFSTHPNYYKLLVDFSVYDSNGNYCPHEKVKLNIPDSVPVLVDGKVEYQDTEEYIMEKMEAEMKVRDRLAYVMADESSEGFMSKLAENLEDAYAGKPLRHSKVQNSDRDSYGRKLTMSQQEFFKDSKVRDDKGNLLVVYHGTPTGGFTIFKNDLTFFSPEEWYANRYQSRSASSRKSGKQETQPMTYKGYLNITKPFDINDPETKKIFIEEYVKGGWALGINPYISYSEIEKSVENGIDWTEADNLKEFFDEMGYDYDGIILNEGGDMDSNTGEVTMRGISYVIFNSNQFKNIDNTNPTSNPDIRYSDRNVNNSLNLIAVHGTNEMKLLKALELEGLPSISTAIINIDDGLANEGYGEISLIFDKDTIDPQKSGNAVYGSDIWSPTHSSAVVERQFDNSGVRKFDEKIKELSMKVADGVFSDYSKLGGILYSGSDSTDESVESLSTKFDRNESVMSAYLADKGISINTIMKPKNYHPRFSNKALDYVLDVFKDDSNFNGFSDELLDLYMDSGNKNLTEEQKNRMLPIIEQMMIIDGKNPESVKRLVSKVYSNDNSIYNIINAVMLYDQNGRPQTEEIDKLATYNEMETAISKDYEAYHKWIADMIEKSGVFTGEEGLYNGKDRVTNNGRRSFKQTHIPITASNIVNLMSKEEQRGLGYAGHGAEGIQALTSKKYSSIDEIRNDKSRLKNLSEEDYKSMMEKYDEKLNLLARRIAEYNHGASYYSISESFKESALGKRTTASIRKAYAEYGFKISDELIKESQKLFDEFSKIPSKYFEAKANRVVDFSEIKSAVIPDNSSKKLVDALNSKGISYEVYSAGDNEERVSVIRNMDNIRFSDRNSEINIDSWLEALSVEDLIEALSVNVDDETSARKEKIKAERRKDIVNEKLKKLGLEFNGTKVASWTDENLEKQLKAFASSNKDYAQAYIAYMSPMDFLKLSMGSKEITYDRIESESKEYGDVNFDKLKESVPIFLDINESGKLTKVTGHEGRHRMMLLGKAGFEKVPVLLFNYSNKYSKEIRNGVTLKPQTFSEDDFVSSSRRVTVDEMIPLSNGNKDLIRSKFGSGSKADVYFSDRITTKADNLLGVNRDAEIEALKAEIDNLKAKVKLERQITNGTVLNDNQIYKVAQSVRKLANSKYDTRHIAKELKEIYSYINNSVDVDGNAVFAKLFELARDIASEEKPTIITDDYMMSILKSLHGKIRLTPEIESLLVNEYGKNFRSALKGLLYFGTDEGTSLDQKWQSLSALYPETFDENITGEDQLFALIDIAQATKEASKQVQTFNDEEAIKDIAYAMYDGYWSVSAYETTADKYQKKIDELDKKHKASQKKLQDRINTQKLADDIHYGAIIENLRQQRDNARKDARKKYDKMEETREKNRLIGSITKNSMELNKKLVDNSVKSHIPQNMRGIVVGLLNAIDYSSKSLLYKNTATRNDLKISKALEKVRRLFSQMEADQKDEIFSIDLPVGYEKNVDKLIDSLEELEQRNSPYILNEMSVDQLNELNKIIKIIKSAVNNMNKWNSSVKGNFIHDCEDSIAELYDYKVYEEKDGLLGKFKTTMLWKNTNPIFAFERFGKTGMKVFGAIQDGWDKYAYLINDIKSFSEESFTEKECEEWENDVHEFDLSSGTVKINSSQLMSLYCLMKREHAREHLLTGGIKIKKFGKGKKLVSQAESYTVSISEVAMMLNELTDRQKEVAMKLQAFMNNECKIWGNEVTMARYGFEAYDEDNYFPIIVNQNNISSDSNDNENSLFRLLNLSFTNPLTNGANGSIEIDSIFNVFANHTTDMAKYNALALPVLDAFKWFSFKARTAGDAEGHTTMDERSVKESIERAFGNDAKSYIVQFLRDINGQHSVARELLGNGLLSNSKMASVGFNARVVALQPTSYLRAFAVLDADDLAVAFTRKGQYKIAEQYCGMAMWKSLGFYDVNVGRGLTEMIKRNQTKFEKLQEFSMSFAGKADEITIGYLWNACEHNVLKHDTLSGEELNKATALKLRDVIYHTQVVDSTMTRSEMMRSKDGRDKILTSFMSEPILSYNLLEGALYQYAIDAGKTNKSDAFKKNGKKIARTMIAYTVTNLVASIVESGFDALRDKKEELTAEDLLEMLLSNFKEDMSIIGKIPVLKDVKSIFNGYSSSSLELTAVSSFYNAWKEIDKALNGKKTNPYKLLSNLLKGISYGIGLPLSNGERDIKAIFNRTGLMTYDEMEDWFNEIIGKMFPSLKI